MVIYWDILVFNFLVNDCLLSCDILFIEVEDVLVEVELVVRDDDGEEEWFVEFYFFWR